MHKGSLDTSGPTRMCVICRKRLPKADLDRFVSLPGADAPAEDPAQRLQARGFYRCRDNDCRERSRKHRLFCRKPKGDSA